ncbi:MAG: Holliday junction resolvase RuvX [Candidatus Margulisbacteria bacterium]|nr:Holliday junction resolvase RuvX [Candidatus Margulisiibacteriota bacterium]
MRIVGLDFGEKRIGVAISDPLKITAQGIGTINKSDTFEKDIAALKDMLKDYSEIEEIVVGLPKTLKGEIGLSARKVLDFVSALKEAFAIKISTWDERMTTVSATKSLIEMGLSRQKRKKVIDKTAASLILQGYLDVKR